MLFSTRSFFIAFCCAFLTACGAIKLTYNNADSLVYWWLDDYVDFSVDQKVRAKNELASFHQWHRKNQLPVWAKLTHHLQELATHDVTTAQLCTFADQVRDQALMPLSNQIEPQVLWLITHLSNNQIKSIEEKYAKTNEKWRDEWQPKTKRELIKNLEKSIRERTDSLYGSLEDSQRTWLREYLNTHPFDAKMAYAERLRRQQDVLTTLKDIQTKKLSAESAKEPMRALLQRSLHSPNATYVAYADRAKLATCELYAKLHNQMNPEQRTHALSKLKDYERDFKTLQKQP